MRTKIFIVILCFLSLTTSDRLKAQPNISRTLLYGAVAGSLNLGALLLQDSPRSSRSVNFGIMIHASVFTGLSVMNIMAKSVPARTMGLTFLPLALSGNYLYLRPQKRRNSRSFP